MFSLFWAARYVHLDDSVYMCATLGDSVRVVSQLQLVAQCLPNTTSYFMFCTSYDTHAFGLTVQSLRGCSCDSWSVIILLNLQF